jgi:uncharacterized protein (TIGR01244 family)
MQNESPGRRRLERMAFSACAALLVAGNLFAGVPEAMDPAEIPAYHVISPTLAVGGQPSPAVLARLAEMGFRTVVNLRTAAEGAEEEGRIVRGAGLDYVWVPVTPATFSLEDVRRVEEVLDDAGRGPVLLHCASSNRVGGLWAAIEARRGRSLAEAEEAGQAAGLRSPTMTEAVRRVLHAPPAAPCSATALGGGPSEPARKECES